MDFNSFIFPAPKKRPNYPELKDHLFWVPVYQKSSFSQADMRLARLSTEMHLRTEPASSGNRLPRTKLLASCVAPVSSRKQRPSIIFSSREDRHEATSSDKPAPPSKPEAPASNPTPAYPQPDCPAMRVRINLSRLKMNEARLVGFPSSIQLNLAQRKRLLSTFPAKNALFKKGTLSSAVYARLTAAKARPKRREKTRPSLRRVSWSQTPTTSQTSSQATKTCAETSAA